MLTSFISVANNNKTSNNISLSLKTFFQVPFISFVLRFSYFFLLKNLWIPAFTWKPFDGPIFNSSFVSFESVIGSLLFTSPRSSSLSVKNKYSSLSSFVCDSLIYVLSRHILFTCWKWKFILFHKRIIISLINLSWLPFFSSSLQTNICFVTFIIFIC